MVMMKSRLIAGHLGNYRFKFYPDSACPHCLHLGLMAPALWPLSCHRIETTLPWELGLLGASLCLPVASNFQFLTGQIPFPLWACFPTRKFREPDWAHL